ncbi:MAG TPA: peptide ABC transporter ATP-binding protein, partial [Erysipelotrichaceae bacterium]|nr:peptide ABC transporter ATP-binding protein [Erysipelotrichaceae bacterium]
GKSTTARILAGIETPSEGSAFYRGKDLFTMTKAEKAAIRTEIQMIFQDNYASLNPRRRVYDILVEPLLYHHRITKDQADAKV